MASHYMENLLDLYEIGEIDGSSLINQVTLLTKCDENIQSINLYRIMDKITDKLGYSTARSPEDIILEREKQCFILHFINWIRSMLTPYEWYLWKLSIVDKKNCQDIANIENMSRNTIRRRLATINHKIKELLPYYNEQYLDIYEYLKG